MTTSTNTTPQANAWGVGVTDRHDLTMMLVSAAQERPGAFLAALRGCTRDLDTDAQDDAFLQWLAGWDAEIVAGVIRLLRLAGAS